MPDFSRFRFRRVFFIAAGGAGNAVLLTFRALVIQTLGFIPECWRFLGLDFASDPPRPPTDLMRREIPVRILEHAAYGPSELRLLELPPDCSALAERIKSGDPDTAWIGTLVPPRVLAEYSSGEALQLPAFTRLALAWAADDNRPGTARTWLGLMEDALADLTPGGAAERDLITRRHVQAPEADPALVVLAVGTGGGTGNGALGPLAIAARSIAAGMGQPVNIEALLLAGHYRSRDGQEARKLAIANALELDVEHGHSGERSRAALPLGPTRELVWEGRLFDSLYREEAAWRLEHNFAAAVAQAADTMLFRYLSASAASLLRSHNNIGFMPRLLKLTEAPATPGRTRAEGASHA
jgi:hypothetical protein